MSREDNLKIVYVYENYSSDAPVLMGRLYFEYIKGHEIFSFEYDDEFLKNTKLTILDPSIGFYPGRQFTKGTFGIFSDSAPDRWGRVLMRKREEIIAKAENREVKNLNELDFILGVDDYSRMGAIRFSLSAGGKFVSSSEIYKTPPITEIRKLENAAREYENEEYEDSQEDEWVNVLFSPGSSLGGARPKSNVIDENGNLWIAKFPSKNDDIDAGAWEYVLSHLAKMCGISVPETKLMKLSQYGTTFLSKRFDREGEKRIHFASAMTLLGKKDGETDECSYLDLAEFIIAYGSRTSSDLKELYKRMVFSVITGNTDNHLRNHGFILEENGWRLSPAYDMNPSDSRYLALGITENNRERSLDLCAGNAKYYGLTVNEARNIIMTMQNTIEENIGYAAYSAGISKKEFERVARAFSCFVPLEKYFLRKEIYDEENEEAMGCNVIKERELEM